MLVIPHWVILAIYLAATAIIGRTSVRCRGVRRAIYAAEALCTLYLSLIYLALYFEVVTFPSYSSAMLVRVGVGLLGVLIIIIHIDNQRHGC